MLVHFHKYQATGNDFVLIDNRTTKHHFSASTIGKLCNRRFGVGADGLILIEETEKPDFKMTYYNPDGTQSLCGNGCRAAVAFAAALKIIRPTTSFVAFDGLHEATVLANDDVQLKLNDVDEVRRIGDDFFIYNGSPHYVRFTSHLDTLNVNEEGHKIRHDPSFKPGGTNVNFVALHPTNRISVRTFERGVEDETFSCGTGVVAAALAASYKGYTSPLTVDVRGGVLQVAFEHKNTPTAVADKEQTRAFGNISLIGPAKMVFEGDLEL